MLLCKSKKKQLSYKNGSSIINKLDILDILFSTFLKLSLLDNSIC